MFPIPANATRIRYLESTGTQYVDTGIVPTPSLRFEIVFAETVRQTNTNAGIFGREITDGNTTRCALFIDWTHHPVFYGDNKVTFGSVLPVNQATSFGASASTGECHVGNTSLNGFTLNGSYTDTVRIFPNQAKPAIGRVYSCQIFAGSALVRDFQPIRVWQVGYLFDRVSGQLFGNAGTGDFVCGPDTFSQGVVPTRMMAMGVRKNGVPHIYIPSGQYFNLSTALKSGEEAAGLVGNNQNFTAYSFELHFRLEGNAPTSNDYLHTLFGPKGINTWYKYFGVFGRYATWFKTPTDGLNISSYIYDGKWHTINLQSGSIIIDGTSHSFSAGSWTASGVWERLIVGAKELTTSPVSIRSFSCRDGSNNLVFSLIPTKDQDGYGAFLDTVSGTLCKAYETTRTMPTYIVE